VGSAITAGQIDARLAAARSVFEAIDLFVAPSAALGADYQRFGLSADKLEVSDYGFARLERLPRSQGGGRLRIGFVGTFVWHKGVHVLLEASRRLPAERFEVKVFGDVNTFLDYTATLRGLAEGSRRSSWGIRQRGGLRRVRRHRRARRSLALAGELAAGDPRGVHGRGSGGGCARQGGIPGLVTHDVNRLVYDAFSPSALAAALQALIDDPSRLGRLGAGAAAFTVKTLEEGAREWEVRYERVLGRVATPFAPST
jgi:glycosyltransferase involved in cell wall biosynthesis